MATDQRERELKFDVPDGWNLPDPAELVPSGGSLERAAVHLESAYFDTPERCLLRAGLTLRRRSGDADVGWHLKVPDGDARTEIRLPLDGESVPAELQEITRGVRGGAALRQIARLTTEREIARVCAADGTGLVEIAVDEVTAAETRHDDQLGGDIGELQRWREVEVELLDGDEKSLRQAAKWLQRSGARPARTASKLARALDDAAPSSPGEPAGGLGDLIAAYLDEQWDAILRGDIALRRGGDAVHRTRVGTRRYRSVLRVFGELFDSDRAARLDGELRWYAQALGQVRDRQVMRDHLDRQLAALPPELLLGPVANRIHTALDAELARAREALDEVLASERYFALLRELRDWREALPLARNPAAGPVEQFLSRSKRKAAKRLEQAGALPAGERRDLAMHRARKAAKRARYTAELAGPVVGKRAAKIVTLMKQRQDELGDRQDAVVAADFLRHLGAVAGTTPGENGFTFGMLYERELRRAEQADSAASGGR